MQTHYDHADPGRTAAPLPISRAGGNGAGAMRARTTTFQSPLADKLLETTNHDAIVTEAPRQQSRLTFIDAACLVINRMIGTGIYSSPRTVLRGTKTTGGAMLLWFLGTICSLAGAHVYIEYGLNVPRFVIDGVEQAVPRSGGDLHYLSFVYNWPYYAKGTVLYSACLYGISFICVGNMAGNCINFAIRVLLASNPDEIVDHAHVWAIATAAGFFSCAIHAVSRRGGILLNDFFAIIKVLILITIPAATFAVLAQAVKDSDGNPVPNVFIQNLNLNSAFKAPENTSLEKGTVDGYAAAFLSILFAFGGIEQSNHVLGEIKSPRKNFPRALTFAVSLVSLLYMIANLCYMAVVPAAEQLDSDVALVFFQKIFSRSSNDQRPGRIFNSFLALSSFGNIIVTTYTAARMKQEIAKQGFIPFSRFFAQNTDLSIGRLVIRLRKRGWRVPFIASPEEHQEPTPVGALVLHMGACLVLIWSTYKVAPIDAYGLLTNLTAYLITAFFGMFLALGILILRFHGPPGTENAKTKNYRAIHADNVALEQPIRRTWRDMVGGSVHSWLSLPAAVLYLLALAFPVVASWIPSASNFKSTTVRWYVVPTICWVILGVATTWWLCFLASGRYRESREHKTLVHEVWPEFDWADPAGSELDEDPQVQKRHRNGGKILVHETVLFTWEGKEMKRLPQVDGGLGRNTAVEGHLDEQVSMSLPTLNNGRHPRAERHAMPADDIAGTPFANFGTPRWNDARAGNNQNMPW